MSRLLRYPLTLFVIFSLNFIIPRVMPGDPVTRMMGRDASVSAAAIEALRRDFGLDRPLGIQYLRYWKGILRLDLGDSYLLHEPVSRIILKRAPWTLGLAGAAVLIGSLAGILAGALAGWNRGTGGRAAALVSIAVTSAPPFFLAMILLDIFAFRWGLFPFRGLYDTGSAFDILRHYVLPVFSLSLPIAARNLLVMQGSVIHERDKPYVFFARLNGMPERRILFGRVFRNASLPLVTLIALDFGFILSGALIIEIVFSMNGMGLLIFEALSTRDYPVLQGMFLVVTVMVVAANLTADLIYPRLDPRVRRVS